MTHGVYGLELGRLTYGYLRWLMVCLPVLLFVVTTLTALQQQQLEPSISAYYGGPVRDVFVGSLIAIAACLVVYQGTGLLEDYALNGAGFYAVLVALVPTGFDGIMSGLATDSPDGVTPADHVWFLRIALTCVVVLCAVLVARDVELARRNPAHRGMPLRRILLDVTLIPGRARATLANRLFLLVTAVVLVLFLGLTFALLWVPEPEEVTLAFSLGPLGLSVHGVAAVLLIASLAVAVVTHTWPFYAYRELRASGRLFYLVIVGAMSLGAVVPWVAARLFAPGHFIILLEWWEIGLFTVFWALESRRVARLGRDPQGTADSLLVDPERVPLGRVPVPQQQR